jgi:DNA-binding Lrp family transcriptional regulator
MKRIKLDKIDKKILKNLQNNGRMTNVDLAKNAGISAPPCLRRVKALEEHGLIKSYHAKLDNLSLGYGLSAFVLIKLKSQAEADLKKFEEECCEIARVREIHMLSGDIDFILRVVAKDWDNYQEFLTQRLTTLDNIESVKTLPLLRSTKDLTGVPIEV